MTPVSSTAVRAWGDTSMDGVALNHAQRLRVHNPSPERDSLAEHLAHLYAQHPETAPAVGEMLRLLRELADLNAQEGGIHQQLAGEFDRLARTLRHAELNLSDAPRAITANQIVAELREPLRVLRQRDRHTESEVAQAGAVVMGMVARVPERQLLAAKVKNNLGSGPYRTLSVLVRHHHHQQQAREEVIA